MTAIADPIKVHLPDGSIKEFPAGSTPFDVAQSISPRLAAAAIVARVRPASTNGTGNDSDAHAEAAPSEDPGRETDRAWMGPNQVNEAGGF